MKKIVSAVLLILCSFSPVLATSSQLFYQETPLINSNQLISVDLSNTNYTEQADLDFPSFRIDYALNPLAELKITPQNAGLKILIGENLAFYGSLDYTALKGSTTSIREIVTGFAYLMDFGKLKINFNPYLEGSRLNLFQGNLGIVYSLNPRLELIGEYLFNHYYETSYYQAAVLGARFKPRSNLTLDIGAFSYLNKMANNSVSSYKSSIFPTQLKISLSF